MSRSATTPRFHEKREAILDGAARQFNRHGIKGATLAEVAASVGLATNSLTYYYRKKEDLACACLLRSMGVVQAMAAEALAGEADVAARIRRFIHSYLERLAEIAEGTQPELVVFNDVRSLTPPHTEAVYAAYIEMFRAVRRLLRDDAALPLSRDALNARAHLLLSIATWTRAWISRYEPADHARVAGCIADVMVNGLGRPGQAAWGAEVPADVTAPGAAPGTPPDAARADSLAATPADLPDTREAYLRAATRLINEHGYRGASVERIAAELHLTKGSFYHHHETKDELVSACFERTFAAMRAVQSAAAGWSGSGWQRLERACRALVRYQMSEHGPLLRVSAWSALPEAMRRDKLRTMGRLGDRFAALLVDGMADGSIRPLDQAVAAQLLSGMVNAAAELERWVDTLPRRSSTDAPALPAAEADAAAGRAAELYARPLFEGLLAPEAAPARPVTAAAPARAARRRQQVQA